MEDARSSAPTPAHLVPFARSVLSLLFVWPALNLVLEHSPPKPPQSEESLLQELASELVGAFLDASSPPNHSESLVEEIEDFLLGWVFATLDVRIEDDSEVQISRDLDVMWKEWIVAEGDEARLPLEGCVARVESLARRRREKRAAVGRFEQSRSAMVNEDGEETDDDSSEGDCVDGMAVDAPSGPAEPKLKAGPEVDDEGFTTVTKGGRI